MNQCSACVYVSITILIAKDKILSFSKYNQRKYVLTEVRGTPEILRRHSLCRTLI
jgi:hypothetical protein